MRANEDLSRYLNEIAKTALLTVDEERLLANRIQAGDTDAHEHMVRANLRLVVKIAGDYSNLGLPLSDLVAEGNTGLMRAAERFDPDLGKFSTYAAFWIKQAIRRALANQTRTVRLPVHAVEKVAKVRKVSQTLEEELGREPMIDEIAEVTGIPRSKLSDLLDAAARPVALDAPVGDGADAATYGDIIADSSSQAPDAALSHFELLRQIEDFLDILDERELSIVTRRFGLRGLKAETLEEISGDFGVTRERIRQIQNVAINKMRKHLEIMETPGIQERQEIAKRNHGSELEAIAA